MKDKVWGAAHTSTLGQPRIVEFASKCVPNMDANHQILYSLPDETISENTEKAIRELMWQLVK